MALLLVLQKRPRPALLMRQFELELRLAIDREAPMMIYTLVAVADVLFLVAGWLFMRRFGRGGSNAGLAASAVLDPFMLVGIAYLILYLAIVGPGCPNARWAC